jgi:hypothetical protein
MQDKYEDFKEKWEDLRESQGFRWGVGAVAVIGLVSFFVLGKEKTDLSGLFDPAPTSVFGTSEVGEQMQAYEIDALVSDIEKRDREREKAAEERERLRQEEMKRIQDQRGHLNENLRF